MKSPIRVGLVGYGAAAAAFHAPLVVALPEFRLAAIASRRVGAIEQAHPGVPVYPDLTRMLAESSVDLVVIATPNDTHCALALEALESGRHVVIDKPIAVDLPQADTLIATAARLGRVLSVFQNRRWDGDYLAVRRAVASGQLGQVRLYEAHFHRFRPTPKPGWRESARPGAGILYDLGAHLIDQALELFGMPEDMQADLDVQRPAAQAVDYFRLTLMYPGRRVILSSSSVVADPGPRFAVHGDGGSLLTRGIDPQEAALRNGIGPLHSAWPKPGGDFTAAFTDALGRRQEWALEPGRYLDYYRQLAACLLHEGPCPVDARGPRQVLRLIELAQHSAREGCRMMVRPA